MSFSLFAPKLKHLSTSPEITTKSPPLLYDLPGLFFTPRLPKPSKSHQSPYLTHASHWLNASDAAHGDKVISARSQKRQPIFVREAVPVPGQD